MILQKTSNNFFYAIIFIVLLQSCEKKVIDFGTGLGDTYAGITRVDSIGVNMSTYFLDSFATTKPATLLLGRYKDPVLGTISAKPFLQLSPPTDITITNDAVYDSITFVFKPNKYYYGDTSKTQTIQVKELDAPIDYTYGTSFYNSTTIAEKTTVLGSVYRQIRPNKDDSISIRLDDTKGLELFNKMKQRADEVQSQDAFLNYFKGLSVSFSNIDSAAIYGVTDSVYIRVHYHSTIPYHVDMSKDFLWYSGGLYFNQLLSNRTGTALAPLLNSGTKEISSTVLNGKGYSQGAAGVQLKVTFPSIRNILQENPNIKVLKATLVLRIAAGTYDNDKLKIPESLYLGATDATNALLYTVSNTDGEVVYTYPVIDHIYDAPPSYSFDITTFISTLIATSGLQDNGLFVQENYPGENGKISRGIFNNYASPVTGSQLILTLLTIKN